MNSNEMRQCQTTRAGRATLLQSLGLPRPTPARQGSPRPTATARRHTALPLAAGLGLVLFGLSLVRLTAACTPAATEVGGDIALRLAFRVGEQYRVSQGYCKDGWGHTGYEVDFAMPPSTPVVAVSAGTVVQLGTYADTCTDMETKCGLSGFEQGGLFVKLQHPASEAGQAWYSSYLHLSTQSVALGQPVATGEIIGLSGNTGLSSGPHLHFQVRKGPADNPLNNPANHLGVRPTPMTGLETDTGSNPVTTFTESFWYRATGAPTFSVGDSVQVFSRAVQGLTPLPVRSEACGAQIASKADGQSGVIIGGPAFCEDYTRWQIRWSDGVEGWSGQNWLRLTAEPCAGASVTPPNRSHGAGAETGSVAVAVGNACAWTAVPSAGWITITSGGSGTGNGSVNYSLSANPTTAARSGTIAVAGKGFAITQAGTASGTTGMAFIPAGSFTMGDGFSDWPPAWGVNPEIPIHTVYVSAFYMDRYEVTKVLWDEIYNWAITDGYSFEHAALGKAINHPAHSMAWHDAVKWCNARSEKEGRVPAYYTDAAHTTVYRSGQVNVQNDWVKWNAGYRLPTEAEWEKAARGGRSGQRFPWGDTITQSWANYSSRGPGGQPYYAFDENPTAGYHSTFATGGDPYTSPVDNFAPNGYGLLAVAGNVWEWCWDWHEPYSGASQTDPHGPVAGSTRVARGGSWCCDAVYCRVASRNHDYPTIGSSYTGFRSLLPASGVGQGQVFDLTSGLVAYYPFDGNANDASGNGNNGRVFGATLTVNRFGQENSAYNFDGQASYILVPDSDSLELTNELSLVAWVRPVFAPTTRLFIIAAKHTAGPNMDGTWAFMLYGDARGGFEATPYFDGNTSSSLALPLGVWHQVAMTYKRNTAEWRIFIDGVLNATGLRAFDIRNTSNDLIIGAERHLSFNPPYYWFFNGDLDDIRIYNRALSAAEVQQLYGSADIVRASSPGAVPPPSQVPTPTIPVRQPTENNLIVITHGYQWNGVFANVAWVDTMADAIRANLQQRDLNNWQVVPIKWNEAAWGIPTSALAGARITGALYGAQFAQTEWQHIHLIGHSAGSVFIEAFAKEIKAIWPATTIHSTFLDPYLSVNWGLGQETYGVISDWADSYFAHDWTGIFTEGSLAHAHAVDVAWLDPQKQVVPRYCPSGTAGSTSPYASAACGEDVKSSHGWPVDFYLATINGTAPAGAAGYGFALSREAGGTADAVSHAVGNAPVVLGGPAPSPQGRLPLRTDLPLSWDTFSLAASDTGVTLFDRSGAGLYCAPAPPPPPNPGGPQFGPDPTGVPAWLAIGVTVTNPVNWVAFEAAFASTNIAEGLLTVYWNTNRLGTLDERVTDAGLHSYRFALPETVSSGLHVVGFRLDSFNSTRSSATVTNVALGYAGLTQPITLAMLPPASNTPPWLSLTAPAGFNYTVETSTNLLNWTPSALLVNTNGTVLFADPTATNGNERFYRARLQ